MIHVRGRIRYQDGTIRSPEEVPAPFPVSFNRTAYYGGGFAWNVCQHSKALHKRPATASGIFEVTGFKGTTSGKAGLVEEF